MTRSILSALILLTAVTGAACSIDDERAIALRDPRLAPTTRAMESIQSKLDPIAAHAQQGANAIERAATDASTLGVPGAGAVALLAGLVGTVLGIYNERRRTTQPLRSAFAQVIESVEAAFPNRTESQKLAMRAVQDQRTRRLVESAKAA